MFGKTSLAPSFFIFFQNILSLTSVSQCSETFLRNVALAPLEKLLLWFSEVAPEINYTPRLKKSHLWLAITLTHMNGFWYFFGRNVTDKVGNQKTLYYATSNNLCFCTTWQNAETWKSHISLNWIVLHTQCTCALYSWKTKLSSVMCLIASNICWGSKISH